MLRVGLCCCLLFAIVAGSRLSDDNAESHILANDVAIGKDDGNVVGKEQPKQEGSEQPSQVEQGKSQVSTSDSASSGSVDTKEKEQLKQDVSQGTQNEPDKALVAKSDNANSETIDSNKPNEPVSSTVSPVGSAPNEPTEPRSPAANSAVIPKTGNAASNPLPSVSVLDGHPDKLPLSSVLAPSSDVVETQPQQNTQNREKEIVHEAAQVKGRIFDDMEEKQRFEQSKHQMEALTAQSLPFDERVKSCTGKCGEGLNMFTVWTTSPEGWNHKYTHSIDSALYHHPKAKVTLYSSSLPSDFLDEWKALGYNVNVEKINLKERAETTPLKEWGERLEEWHTGPYYYAHLSDALRLVVLYNEGGVYFDTDVVFVNNMDSVRNVVGWERSDSLCNALMAFDKGNPYIGEVLTRFNKDYVRDDWASNGPVLLTKVYREQFSNSKDVNAFDKSSFYLISWTEVQKFFEKASEKDVEHDMAVLKNGGYVVHYWNSRSHDLVAHPQSLMAKLFVTYCVHCNPIHNAVLRKDNASENHQTALLSASVGSRMGEDEQGVPPTRLAHGDYEFGA